MQGITESPWTIFFSIVRLLVSYEMLFSVALGCPVLCPAQLGVLIRTGYNRLGNRKTRLVLGDPAPGTLVNLKKKDITPLPLYPKITHGL